MSVLCNYPGYVSSGLAQRLGNAPHNHQIRVRGLFPSRRAFIIAAQEAGLVPRGSISSALTYLRNYGYVDDSPTEDRQRAYEPGKLYVQGDMSTHAPVLYESVKS